MFNGREVFEGTLYVISDFETHAILLTGKDKETVLENAGSECFEKGDFIFCTSIDYSKLRLMGTILEDVLSKHHGKKVKITVKQVK